MKKENLIVKWTLPLALSIVIISFAALFALYFRGLYYWDIDYLGIPQSSHLSKEKIISNYNVLIDYLTDKDITELELPSFGMSKQGKIHFEDVKNIFNMLKKTIYIIGLYSLIGVVISLFQKNYSFLKHTAISTVSIPLCGLTFAMINFDKSFIIFHKMAFRNDYWVFDPALDPVITMLPQEFFMHSFLLIVATVILISLILSAIYLSIRSK